MTADCGLRGLALLDAAIDRIAELEGDESARGTPSGWDQRVWRCETGMCLAGHIADMCGGRWATDPWHGLSSVLLATPEDRQRDVVARIGISGRPNVIEAMDRAKSLLGLSVTPCIFESVNDLFAIRRYRDEMVRAGEIQ